jgi:hypothetical protein
MTPPEKALVLCVDEKIQAEDKDAELSLQIAADPTGVDMDRVNSTMRAIGQLPLSAGYSLQFLEYTCRMLLVRASAPPSVGG